MVTAQQSGALLIYATGRRADWIVPQLELPVSGAYGICSNGAWLVELENDQTIDKFPMSKALTITALTALHRALPTIHFAADCSSGFYVDESFKYSWRLRPGAIAASIMSIVTAGDQVYKLTAFCDGMPEQELCERIDQVLHSLVRTTYGASLNFVRHPTHIERAVPVEVRRSLGDKGENLDVLGERPCLGARHQRVEQADEALHQDQKLRPKLLVLELSDARIDVGLQIRAKGYADIGKVLDHCITGLPELRQELFGLADPTGQIALILRVIKRQCVCQVLSDAVVVHDNAEALGWSPWRANTG